MVDTKTRDKVFAMFHKLFDNNITTMIEKSILNFSINYAENNDTLYLLKNIYITKADEIYSMVKDEKLYNAITAIKNNKLDPSNIATIKPSELNMILSNKQYADIVKKREINMMFNEKKGTNAFECEKCHKKNASVIEKQTRSADEPATLFITCLECNHTYMI